MKADCNGCAAAKKEKVKKKNLPLTFPMMDWDSLCMPFIFWMETMEDCAVHVDKMPYAYLTKDENEVRSAYGGVCEQDTKMSLFEAVREYMESGFIFYFADKGEWQCVIPEQMEIMDEVFRRDYNRLGIEL